MVLLNPCTHDLNTRRAIAVWACDTIYVCVQTHIVLHVMVRYLMCVTAPPHTTSQGEPWPSVIVGHMVDEVSQQADTQRLMLERFQMEVGLSVGFLSVSVPISVGFFSLFLSLSVYNVSCVSVPSLSKHSPATRTL